MGCFKISAFQVTLAVLAGFLVTLQVSASKPVSLDSVEYRVDSTISHDVCIVGGGSSGTYAAIRLSDMGKCVLVIEQQDRLCGHTETYTEPMSRLKYDIGVEVVSMNKTPSLTSFPTRRSLLVIQSISQAFFRKRLLTSPCMGLNVQSIHIWKKDSVFQMLFYQIC